jgi:rod shape-determining protein MreC
MPLGTLDRTPPPIFHQGLPARTKLIFFSALALFLMVADARFKFAPPLREAIAVALAPVQRALLVPVQALVGGSEYLQGLQSARAEQVRLAREMAALSERALSAERLATENAQLRALLDMRPALPAQSLAAQVLFEAADPFSRKVVLDVGAAAGVRAGAPVLHPQGVLGQVTRVYALTSEVTLLADRDAAIAVLNARTQQRAAAFGGVQGAEAAQGARMALRFTLPSADVQVGDVYVTGGLDGVFPPALPVARVSALDRRGDGGFARVLLTPAAPSEGVRHVLVLQPVGTAPAATSSVATAASAAASAAAATPSPGAAK